LDFLKNLKNLDLSVKNLNIRLDRIIFSNLSAANSFISYFFKNQKNEISNTPSSSQNTENLYTDDNTISIVCPLNSIYEIEPLLNNINKNGINYKMEILCSDNPKSIEDLQFLLQDKLPELNLKTIPRFSLIYPDYQINLADSSKKIRKRNRKPPIKFQNILKKYAPQIYPNSIGNDYFGKAVFDSYLTIYSNLVNQMKKDTKKETHNLEDYHNLQQDFDINEKYQQYNNIQPPSPLKYYDFQENSSDIEFRFKAYLTLDQFIHLFEKELVNFEEDNILEDFSNSIKMLRISCVYDQWTTDFQQKSAANDRFFLTWNDIEFAYREKNLFHLKNFKHNENIGSAYFQLTPSIEDKDFRIQIIEDIFQSQVYLV